MYIFCTFIFNFVVNTSVHFVYIIRTFLIVDVHLMYMRRPSVPEEIYNAVENEARDYEDSWRETLERILEQDAGIEIPAKAEVNA